MKILIPFLLAIGSLVLFSCGNKATTEVAHDHDVENIDTQANEDDHDAITGEIELDNGQKWAVNKEMIPYVLNGEKLVSTYLANNETDYAALAKNIGLENGKLIKSCTMQGKSHEELHKWLNPHLLLVEDLEDATTTDEAAAVIKKLEASYKMYHEYFN